MMIRAEGLTKTYGRVRAVDGLSFEVEPGETFALIGPNGAGKTTTLRLLLGLSRPDAGRIVIGPRGLEPRNPEARRDLGYVPQRTEFPPGRTVRELLSFFARLRGLGRIAVDRALQRVRLAEHADRRASDLSGGYGQRLSLAQALLADPALLVLDEPTASLDPEATWEFRTLVEELQHEGKTILLCSHLLSEVERVADRVLILVEGRRAALEELDALRERQTRATRLAIELAGEGKGELALDVLGRAAVAAGPHGPRGVLVEVANGRPMEAIDALRAAGIVVSRFELQRPTLEELFLRVVRGEETHAS